MAVNAIAVVWWRSLEVRQSVSTLSVGFWDAALLLQTSKGPCMQMALSEEDRAVVPDHCWTALPVVLEQFPRNELL